MQTSHSDLEIAQLIASADWRQRWEILPGIWTPGISDLDAKYMLDEYGIPADLAGKTCIDIGAWDGPISFELERRGAKVIAADIQDPASTAFNVAKKILGSKIEYVQASVYDLPNLFTNQFDIVIFRAVYYHLKNPYGAFEAISQISAPNATLCAEGEALVFYAETLDGKPRYDDMIRQMADWDVPLMLFYTGNYKSGENWNVPNFACFKGWMIGAGFDIIKHRVWEDREINGQRFIVTCQRNLNNVLVEHSVLEKGWRANAVGEIVKGQFIKADRIDTLKLNN